VSPSCIGIRSSRFESYERASAIGRCLCITEGKRHSRLRAPGGRSPRHFLTNCCGGPIASLPGPVVKLGPTGLFGSYPFTIRSWDATRLSGPDLLLLYIVAIGDHDFSLHSLLPAVHAFALAPSLLRLASFSFSIGPSDGGRTFSSDRRSCRCW
jgi:hypothetical protein